MTKLFKYEWKRYGFSIIMLFVASAAVAVLTAISMAVFAAGERADQDYSVMGSASVAMLSVILCIIPYAGYVYPLLSYITDISKRGMLALTPSSTWATTAVKLLMGVGVYTALFLETSLFAWLLTLFSETFHYSEEWLSELKDLNISSIIIESPSRFALTGITGVINTLLSCARIIACIALARFAVNSVGGQVVLAIVFNYLAKLIINMVNALVFMIIAPDESALSGTLSYFLAILENEFSWYTIVGLVLNLLYAGVMYVVASVLTDKKVNLA